MGNSGSAFRLRTDSNTGLFLLSQSYSWALGNAPNLEVILKLEAQPSINVNGTKHSSLGSTVTVILCDASEPGADQNEQCRFSKSGGKTPKPRGWFYTFAYVCDL